MATGEALRQVAVHSMDVALYAWPITVALLAAAAAALFIGSPFHNPRLRRGLKLLLISYIVPFLVILVGAFLRYDGPRAPAYVDPPLWRSVVLWSLLTVHLGVLLSAAILMRGARVRTSAILLPGFWASLSAGFVAGVAIGGVGP